MTILQIIGLYFVLGLLALILLDLITGRVRNRLMSASYDTQQALNDKGYYENLKMSFVLTIGALWLLWPVAIYSAISSKVKGG